MKHSTYEYDGKKYTIEISDSGTFSTTVNDDGITDHSLDGLKKKIARYARKASVRVSIPATLPQGRSRWGSSINEGGTTLTDVTVTGIHQRTGEILFRRDDTNQAGRVGVYNSGQLLKRLSKSERDTYIRLAKASRDAQKAFDDFEKAHSFTKRDIETVVTKAEKDAGIEDEGVA